MGIKTIIYVLTTSHYSGAEIVMHRLISSNRRNIEPIVVCAEGEFADILRQDGIKVVTTPALESLFMKNLGWKKVFAPISALLKSLTLTLFLLKLKKSIGKNIYAIHANVLMPSVYVLPFIIISKLFFDLKYFRSHLDNSFHGFPPKITKFFWNICTEIYDITFVPSQATKDILNKYSPKVYVLYNGIDTQNHNNSRVDKVNFKSKYNLQSNTIIIGIVGKIQFSKGHHLLIEAFGKLIKSSGYENCKLVIIGKYHDGDYKYEEYLQTKVRDIRDYCIFTGQLNNTSQIFSSIDILVNASLKNYAEPLGTTIIEAMAYSKIVLCSNTGGSPEIIADGNDGFLFEGDNIESLFKELSMIITKMRAGQLTYIQQNAVVKIQQKFSLSPMLNTYNHSIGL